MKTHLIPRQQSVTPSSAGYVDVEVLAGEPPVGRFCLAFALRRLVQMLGDHEPDLVDLIRSFIEPHCFRETFIGNGVVARRPNLRHVDIPDWIETIGIGAFEMCPSLETVRIGRGVKRIGSFAFADCAKLRRVEFARMERPVKTYNNVFVGCPRLERIEYPVDTYRNWNHSWEYKEQFHDTYTK